jgi:hypothetical protein
MMLVFLSKLIIENMLLINLNLLEIGKMGKSMAGFIRCP